MPVDYETWHAQLEEDPEQFAGAPWHLATLKHLPDVDGKRVLEIGCGRGLFAVELAARGADLVAADFSPTAVEFARARLPENVQTEVVDIQALPFASESFDLVVSQETLEHVPDPPKGMAELVRVTKRGGAIILTGPNYLNLLGLYRIAARLVGRPYAEMGQPINQPLLLYRQVRRLKKLGCRIDAIEGTGVPLVIPGKDTYYLPARPQWLARWFALNTTVVATRK